MFAIENAIRRAIREGRRIFSPRSFNALGEPDEKVLGALLELERQHKLRSQMIVSTTSGRVAWRGTVADYKRLAPGAPWSDRTTSQDPLEESAAISFVVEDDWSRSLEDEPDDPKSQARSP